MAYLQIPCLLVPHISSNKNNDTVYLVYNPDSVWIFKNSPFWSYKTQPRCICQLLLCNWKWGCDFFPPPKIFVPGGTKWGIKFVLQRFNIDYVGLDMYREWKKIEFPKEYYICIWEQEDWEVDQEIDGKMVWERMEEQLEGKGGITETNGRSSWEKHGIVKFCTCQWNEWMKDLI